MTRRKVWVQSDRWQKRCLKAWQIHQSKADQTTVFHRFSKCQRKETITPTGCNWLPATGCNQSFLGIYIYIVKFLRKHEWRSLKGFFFCCCCLQVTVELEPITAEYSADRHIPTAGEGKEEIKTSADSPAFVSKYTPECAKMVSTCSPYTPVEASGTYWV